MVTVLITAGPTREHLDDVRFLSNGSTGRMGYALARAAAAAGHRALLVSGPVELADPVGVETTRIESALEMRDAVMERLPRAEVVIGAAAVSDFRFARRWPGKPPKSADPLRVELVPNPDIIAEVGAAAGRRIVVGFALESPEDGGPEGVLARGRAKLERKRLDAIAVNTTAALGADRSQIVLLFADGGSREFPPQDKDATAAELVAAAVDLWSGAA